jgi:hypothetical protein
MPPRREERVVAALVEAILPGARMRAVEIQSNREWDFNLEHNGNCFPFEVSRFTSASRHQLYNAILGREGDQSLFPRRDSHLGWWIFPSHIANVRRIRDQADDMLTAVDRDGLETFDINGEGRDLPSVKRLWDELRIQHGTRMQWTPPGQIGIALPGESAMLSADHVRSAVELVANKEDIRIKLGASVAPERHLGVHIDDFGYPAQASMTRGLIPTNAPALPPEVTHIWVSTYIGRDRDYLVWCFDRERGWRDLGVHSAVSADDEDD